ncbi:Smr domain protein [Ophiocordyceps camponoti-floridani]|uniref:Smr domain protein n=1 Tax=Ophiocordyceps camponoti-floridani TaxID=2030778 RepID=A0A8H4QDY3_9HYPO|nr:Smr domain protein [Ophiocordyceps camponoti-floridani]
MADSSLVAKLVDSFHSLLDEALIGAIASDYDLTDPAAFDAAHSLLQRLARNVPSEEATGFNPSGIPIIADEIGAGSTVSASLSRPTSQTVATDLSSAETASSAAGEPVVTVIPRITSYDDDSDESKTRLLRSMFTELKEYDVEYSLKKAKGDFQSALDDLLDIQYLQSTGQQLKGIDGFFDDGNATVSSKKKRKKKKTDKKRRVMAEPGTSRSSHESVVFEDGGQDEIEYIAERFGIRSDEVWDIYNKSQRSGGFTVVELLDQYISHGVESQDEAGRQQADSLMRKYRHVPDKYLPTIVQVAGSISQFADDLAALLNKHFARQHGKKGQKLDLDYRITPLPRDDIESGGETTIKTKIPPTLAKPGTLGQAMQLALDHRQAKRDATATAARLHRSGAANSLYRQAASVYAEQARERGRQAQQAASAAADLMVAENSTESSIDLHGVTVQDGVRIALQRTQDWWDGLGEYRVRKAREHGFTVVTGLGRHCAGGVSRLRQAVAAALLQDRWKLQVLTGMFVVTGRQ